MDAEAATRRLVRQKAPATFRALAAEATVSPGYLHRHPNWHPRVASCGTHQAQQDSASHQPPITAASRRRQHIRRLQPTTPANCANSDMNATLRSESETAPRGGRPRSGEPHSPVLRRSSLARSRATAVRPWPRRTTGGMQIQLHLTGEMPPLMVVAVATTYVIQVLIQCWREISSARREARSARRANSCPGRRVRLQRCTHPRPARRALNPNQSLMPSVRGAVVVRTRANAPRHRPGRTGYALCLRPTRRPGARDRTARHPRLGRGRPWTAAR